MSGITPYKPGRLVWRSMDAYWSQDDGDRTYGPEVLFAWQDPVGKWCFDFGYGMWPLYKIDDESKPSYYCRGYDLNPECFAYVRPPERTTR